MPRGRCEVLLRVGKPETQFLLDESSIAVVTHGFKVAQADWSFTNAEKTSIEYGVDIEPVFQKNGISKRLLESVLKEHPQVSTIVSKLSGVNFKEYKKSLAAGLSQEDAIWQTPAFKVRKALGFTRLVRFFEKEEFVETIVQKP
jgi:GNAT superfamily N-acetyltransferase